MSIRVLVVDDTALFRRLISDALSALPGLEIVGTATNGKTALQQISNLHPDLVTLDIEMPEMNGIETLEELKRLGSKTTAIVLSACTVRGSQLTIKALTLGAFDFIPKPDGGTPEHNVNQLRESIDPVIKAFRRKFEARATMLGREAKLVDAPNGKLSVAPTHKIGSPIVLIGVSTGGPNALAQLLPALPGSLAAPVFVVQHMPALFTRALADRLNGASALRVKEGENGEAAKNGSVYIAPGGKQMKIAPGPGGEVCIRLTDEPPENDCRPAADCLFRSAALKFPGRSIAVVLTGMGKDGTEGLRLIKRSPCITIAQDEASCVVFGMPREAILAGVVDYVLPLDKIAASIVRSVAGATS